MTSLTVDVSDLSDGEQADAGDASTPINQIKTHLENTLDGDQAFEQINFAAATELTIASGAITATQTLHTVDTESDAASDNLDDITMAEGDELFLKAANTARTVVIRNQGGGTGNIRTFDGADLSLDNTEKVVHLLRLGSVVYVLSAVDGTYTVAETADWPSTDPTAQDAALDHLAARLSGRGYIAGLEVSVAGDEQIDVAVGEALDDSHLRIMRSGSAGAIDVTTTGINALDAGSIATSTIYYVWLCQGTSGVGFVASTSASSPTLPSGYDDYKRRIGAVVTDSSSDLIKQVTIPGSGARREVQYTEITDASPYQILNVADIGATGAATAVDCSGLVPSTSNYVVARLQFVTPSTSIEIFWRIGSVDRLLASVGTAFSNVWVETLQLDGSQAGEIYGAAGDEDITFWINGYIDNLLPTLT